jgi:uroporphyrinogen-III decarboxylase
LGDFLQRQFYLDLAAAGLRMPIGADLVLREQPDPESILTDPERLGKVIEETARRFRTPLAFPLMDLRLEKADLLESFGVPEDAIDTFHFDRPPSEDALEAVRCGASRPFAARIQAAHGALRYIARRAELLPIGMLIGPFSLMTKLLADPIPAVALAGGGVSGAEDASVLMAERCLELALHTVERSALAQINAGAKAFLLCEPAANKVYISPRQMRAGSGVFERFVMEPNRRLAALMAARGADLIFHDCGELTTGMVQHFATDLRPSILSLGSSRRLWEDAAVVPNDIVLFGNLPTRTFYSDSVMPVEEVARQTSELCAQMSACGHPHILGSECDVLCVPGAEATIRRKVMAMLNAA